MNSINFSEDVSVLIKLIPLVISDRIYYQHVVIGKVRLICFGKPDACIFTRNKLI